MKATLTVRDRDFAKEAERKQREIGPSQSVGRLLAKYGAVSTRKNYLVAIAIYLRWSKGRGVTMTPNELVKDNPVCIFRSDLPRSTSSGGKTRND
jgi:hypothetical protein